VFGLREEGDIGLRTVFQTLEKRRLHFSKVWKRYLLNTLHKRGKHEH
jgi:hypothetical protein